MKATRQAHNTGATITLHTNNPNDVVSEKETSVLDALRKIIAEAVLGDAPHRPSTEKALIEQELLLQDCRDASIADQIRSIEFVEGILQARSESYAARRNEENQTVTGQVSVTYRSKTAQAATTFRMSSRIPLVLVDALKDVMESDLVEIEELSPKVPKPKKEASAVKKEDVVKEQVQSQRQVPAEAVQGGRDERASTLPLDAPTMLRITTPSNLNPRDAAIYQAGRAHALRELQYLLGQQEQQCVEDLQATLNWVHGAGRPRNKGNRK